VHPDFLQSSADRGRKDTKWLLDWRYPFTSLAAGMVALSRIRATSAESFVVSSKADPFAEVGVINCPTTALVWRATSSGVAHGRPINQTPGSALAWIAFQFTT
jgi:hypothetical protein